MAKRTNKTATVNARVTRKMKQFLMDAAEQRGETEAMIVREALHEYEARHTLRGRPSLKRAGSFV